MSKSAYMSKVHRDTLAIARSSCAFREIGKTIVGIGAIRERDWVRGGGAKRN